MNTNLSAETKKVILNGILSYKATKNISIETGISESYIDKIRVVLGIQSHSDYIRTCIFRMLNDGNMSYYDIGKATDSSFKAIKIINEKYKIREELPIDREKHKYNTLTENDTEDIRYRLSSTTESMVHIAYEFNVKIEDVRKINKIYRCRLKKTEIKSRISDKIKAYNKKHPEESISTIAHKFNISVSTVVRILSNNIKNKNKKCVRGSNIDHDKIIDYLKNSTLSQREIALKCNCSRATVTRVNKKNGIRV